MRPFRFPVRVMPQAVPDLISGRLTLQVMERTFLGARK